ncbi:F-box protein: endocytic membrane traffic, recycling ReCYcling 1 [Tulasnella sp. 418]|nr:F-box protein: endocytic membrane traffic, recycling ReCYcling 1 [Tulasnella sp. 418]
MNVTEQDVGLEDDDFGDFASATGTTISPVVPRSQPGWTVMEDFSGTSSTPTRNSFLNGNSLNNSKASSSPATEYRSKYIRAHTLLKPLLPTLLSPSHLILTNLFPSTSSNTLSLLQQSQTLHLLLLFLSPQIQPVLAWPSLLTSLKSAIDRFEAASLSAFDVADGLGEEKGMKDAAYASWELWESNRENTKTASNLLSTGGGRGMDWELGKVWAEKKDIFYEAGQWDPIKNFTASKTLDFQPMDDFMKHVLDAIRTHGAMAVRVFPPPSGVLISFCERLANEVVGEYIIPLLSHARSISNEIFLQATAATFVQSWRMVDIMMEVASPDSLDTSKDSPKNGTGEKPKPVITKHQAEDVVYRMFEPNMDEYLDEEVESVKAKFELICKSWDKQLGQTSSLDVGSTVASPTVGDTQARFLSSHNPAQVKRTVLASFTDVLLLPVTIVPRTIGVIGSGVGAVRGAGSAAVAGISMLNPQRWGGGNGNNAHTGVGGRNDGYGQFGVGDNNGAALFELQDDDEDEDGNARGAGAKRDSVAKQRDSVTSISSNSLAPPGMSTTSPWATSSDVSPSPAPSSRSLSTTPNPSTPSGIKSTTSLASFDRLQLLLSLDVALEIIHADRESLKRTETFQHYPGHYGHKVRETIEELFILMLQAIGERHIGPGFARATEQMKTYKPAEHEETQSVAPLMQFFELVHIGDTIQSMVQVFFDKELAPHIDKTDFLNGVVREKKRFENTLDDSVAGGLNTGTEVLMNQVEHIITLRTGPREYYPVEGTTMELGPTRGCKEAIACLETHCKLLKGSTNKEVLEVFYQEVGMRLDAIIQKHIKRQIISLEGGFQLIADLNAYHAFISSLKVPQITADFANLKMLGHVFIVSDAKDLAQIVRDVTRYGGSFRPEDVYEFIQRRSDWKKIEKTVDQTMYNLSFKEDCIIC